MDIIKTRIPPTTYARSSFGSEARVGQRQYSRTLIVCALKYAGYRGSFSVRADTHLMRNMLKDLGALFAHHVIDDCIRIKDPTG
jgi:hypothetical protein